MTWVYKQSTGELGHDGLFVGDGYSGHGVGKNNPSMQNIKNVGPIPCGNWVICPSFNHPVLGPCVMRLTPDTGTETFERRGFYLHGDGISDPGNASDGCIVQGHSVRVLVSQSDDNDLMVIA